MEYLHEYTISYNMGTIFVRKENICSLPGLVHIEQDNLSRQHLQAAMCETKIQQMSSMQPISLQELSTRTRACQTWTPMSLKRSCCSAGNCSKRSGEGRVLVLLCACVRITAWDKTSTLFQCLSTHNSQDEKTTLLEHWGDFTKRSVSMSYFRTLKHSSRSSRKSA